ncbi:MAG TPA: hypothetical protein VJB82_04605 [Candidatus Peribacterales bacterium]|nr:hypothetical protein [Candidatus Peribacterales bacterium]
MHKNKYSMCETLFFQREARLICRTPGHAPEAPHGGPEAEAAHGHAAEDAHARAEQQATRAEAKKILAAQKGAASNHGAEESSHGSYDDMWTSIYSGGEVEAVTAAKETVAAGAAGTSAAALAQIATVSGLPHAAVTGGSGYIGWNLGKRYLGKHVPHLAGPIGAAGGIAIAPAIPAAVQGVGSFLSGVGQSSILGMAQFLGGVGGAGLGYHYASKLNIEHTETKVIVRALGTLGGGGVGLWLSKLLAPALQPLLPALHLAGGHLSALGAGMTSYFPALGTTTGALSSSLGVGAAVAALYGMGWANGKLNGYSNTGFVGNLWRGATLIPYGLPKYLFNRGITATRNAVTGNNRLVKGLTSPIWWPIRTALRPVLGLGEGLYSGATGYEASDRYHAKGMTGSIGRGIGSAITSPIWGTKKLVNHLLSPASSSSSSSHH